MDKWVGCFDGISVQHRKGQLKMNTGLFFCTTLILVLCSTADVSAAVREVRYALLPDANGSSVFVPADDQGARVNDEEEEVVFAEFSFEDDFPIGTEIELWPQVEGESAPWELSREEFPFYRNLWTVDSRTGSLIRFDVTEIVQAWNSESLANNGFVLRVIDEAEEPQLNASTPEAIVPVGAILRYRTGIKASVNGLPEQPNNGKESKDGRDVEDASGRTE